MKGLFHFITLMLCAAVLLCSAGCSTDSSTNDKNIRIALSAMPINLDPQLASTDEELLIARNCFEGLFRISKGKVVPAACEKYEVSSNKLTYTFTMKTGLKWSDGSPLTAADFRFGLVRALRPETVCADASLLYSIKGAEQLHSGVGNEADLGITAKSDRTLVIELDRPDNSLFETLTMAMAMPCNRESFEKAGGRYCMSAELTLCNGPFALSKWAESTLRFARNDEYVGDFTARPAAFTLSFSSSDTDRIEKINTDFTDIAVISTQSVKAAEDALLDTVSFYDTVWALVIRPDANVVGDPAVSAALKKAVGSDVIQNALPDKFKATDRLIADDLLVGTAAYQSLVGKGGNTKSNPSAAKNDLITALKPYSGKLPTITVKYADVDGMKQTATRIAQQWTKELGAVVNIVALSESELSGAMATGDYQVALCPISADNGKAVSALNRFATGSSQNIFGYANTEVDSRISKLSGIAEAEALADELKKLEGEILADSHIIPLAQSGKCYAVSTAVVGAEFDCNSGRIALYSAGR